MIIKREPLVDEIIPHSLGFARGDTMTARLRTWWQKIRKPLAVIAVIVLLGGVLLLLILTGYRLTWTGFLNKTLWDWMQLLLVPFMLAIGGFWLNQIQKDREEITAEQRTKIERDVAEKRSQTERDIAADNQREVTLQAYLDRIAELLLKENLRTSQPDDEVRSVARVKTITVLNQLDAKRNGYLLTFLRESGLIKTDAGKCIIDLVQADLSGADLSEVDLSEVDLSEVDLSETNLSRANLEKAKLQKAFIRTANLHNAQLSEADLSEARLTKVDLSGAGFTKVDLKRAWLQDTDLSGADLSEADLSSAYLVKINFNGTILQRANLSNADLDGNDLRYAIFGGFETNQTVRMPYQYLYEDYPGDDEVCYFDQPNLEEASLEEANLSGVDLKDICLRRAKLSHADLSHADLSGADLSSANLRGTNLSSANLKGANLKGCEYNTKPIQERKELNGRVELVTIEPTQWPQGFDPKVVEATCVDC